MPKINLLPKEELEAKPLGRFLSWALSYGRYIIISVEMVVFLVFFSRFIYDRQLADLNDQIEQKQAIIASAQQFEKEFRMIQSVIEYVETLDEGRHTFLDVLTTLERITPIQVAYDDVSFSENTVMLSGEALNNESFAQLLAQLKQVDDFSSDSLDSLAKKEDTGDMISFSITITLNTPDTEVQEASL